MDLLVSYKKIHSELMCCKFEDDTWSLFTYYIKAESLFFLQLQCFGIVFSSVFAVFHTNNTSFITKVAKPDSLKLGSSSLSWEVPDFKMVVVQHNLSSKFYFQVTVPLLV